MERNQKCKRALQILTERSRRPMVILAGGLFALSLPTFVKVKFQYVKFMWIHVPINIIFFNSVDMQNSLLLLKCTA